MANRNQSAYAQPSLVRYYTQIQQLQPAEQGLWAELQARLPTLTMLDLGIGGGRTTQYFWPQVGQYTGIDYSPEMIAACRARFGSDGPNMAVMDARDLSTFADNSFDLIWFSYNGLDYVSHTDRLQILQEVHRVGKPGGSFVFSSHNLQAMAHVFDYRQHLSLNPITTYVDLVMWGLLRWFNRGLTVADLVKADHLILRDESHNFALQTYYIHPEAQIKQLAFGFRDIEVYPWTRPDPIASLKDPALAIPLWLYYRSTIAKA
ncbi:class I SAM-dependent methyltransferase [Leptolyngbya sp. BL0902]|uniref:class I SAM-dependent methyltransferase n=1 Tax=Leptolyngbya sp. BL0902 TaxID=1115757 RepID=UPI0018E83F61|nr:class I SAM-dependent methyltransferase [Leptolyngbya sp. BL0902]